jgi:hypothetical protein
MGADLEILCQNDGFLELLADALADKTPRIQGFLYADHHVIRDVYKPWAEQEIWRRRQKNADDYEACHAAMMRQIQIEELRLAVQRALATVERPWPGQENAAEAAKLAQLAQEAEQ